MVVMKKTVSLNPGESKFVDFQFVPASLGNFTVSVDGLSGGLIVREPLAYELVYASGLIRTPSGGYDLWRVDVQNISQIPGECTLKFYSRTENPPPDPPGQWSSWTLKSTQVAVINPGDIVTFSGSNLVGTLRNYKQFMVKCEAGTLLNPTEPKEFTCACCYDTTGDVVSFDTETELNAHYVLVHPDYAPILPLTHFYLQGLSWPTSFTKYGEDYGKIIEWAAACFLTEGHYTSDDPEFYYPETGNVRVSTSQALHFVMPENWFGAMKGPCGRIPNSTIFRLWFKTDLGWSGLLDDSPWIKRIPDGGEVTFDCVASGCQNWTVTP